ncbi:MAG: glycosyltransferase family 39 protein [Saprospiraceae bacterium]|nr:glycosyltransferase family 39 protein [Saprospiraceae bacterium]
MRHSIIIGFIAALFFLPFLGGAHLFDWDEINFAEAAREMLRSGEYLRVYINYLPFWEKPPLFLWFQAMAMSVFGVGEFAARLPNALCGIVTLVLLYNIGRKLYDHRFGLIWAGVYLGSVLPFLYFKSGIIDPLFNLFIFTGLYLFILFYWKKECYEGIELKANRWTYLFFGGLLLGLGILTKGPVAYLLAALTMFVYWVYQRFRFYVNVPQFLFFTIAATLAMLAWYGVEIWKNGPALVIQFNEYQYRLFSTPDAGHAGFPGYHFVVLLFGCFPASIFLVRALFSMPEPEKAHQKDFRKWMLFLFWVVLILFTIVKSKIVHYSSMCYFPLTFLAATTVYNLLEGRMTLNKWMKAGIAFIGGIYALLLIALPWIMMHPERLSPLFKDPFAQGNLEAEVTWTGWEMLPGIWLLVVVGLSLYWMGKSARYIKGYAVLFGGTAIFVMLTLIFYINRVESYSQRAAIEFFESKAGQRCYLITHGYKSYAHLFYGDVPPEAKPQIEDPYQWKEFLLHGAVDRPVYVVTKVHKAAELIASAPELKEIGRKNGFVFYERAVPVSPNSE